MTVLLSTLLALPDDERAAVERELVPLARAAALGELAADVAHDVANPLFGVIGLVDLLVADVAPGSEEAARLALLAQTTSEMRETLEVLLDFARLAGDDATETTLEAAARSALRLLRHGAGRTLTVEERYDERPARVPCPPGLLVQAVLQLLVAVRGEKGLCVASDGASLRISPAPADTLAVRIAGRIVADHGGELVRDAASVTLRWSEPAA